MKISKNIVTSILMVIITLGVMVGTLLYANQYTIANAAKNNTFQKGNGAVKQGEFQKRPDNGAQGGPANGTIKKSEK